MRRLWRLVIAVLATGVLISGARAHDPGISTAQGELRADALLLTTGFAPADVQQLLPPALRHDGSWTQAEFDAAQGALRELAPRIWEVRAGETSVTPREARVELLPGDNVSFYLVYPRAPDGAGLTLRAPRLAELPPGHRQFVIIADERGSTITKKLLSARDGTIEVPGAGAGAGTSGGEPPAAGAATTTTGTAAPATPPPAAGDDAPTFWGFLRLGVEHIWTGYDHLLFLFALLIVCRSFRSIVGIVTCFTLAHSITLALATFDIVSLPARLVEPAIAASIVFVGAENLWRRGEEPRGRWALTFAFGLIHGFGFASVLRDLGLGRSSEGIALPLFTFNLGVELGQIAVAAVVLPLVWWLRKREAFVRRGVPALSAIVALAGLYWLLERTVFA